MAETPESVTDTLIGWISSVLPAAKTSSLALRAPPLDAGIDVRLVAITPHERAPRDVPKQVANLDYLVTVRMKDAAAELAAVSELLFAAADRHDVEFPVEHRVTDLCAALGLPHSLGFVMRLPLVRVRRQERAPRVRRPLVMQDAAIVAIEGFVVGPEDVPVAGAIVTEKSVGRSARTDASGHFRIIGATPDAGRIGLNVQARGVSADAVAKLGEDIRIRLPLES